jgi:hypothetical protein
MYSDHYKFKNHIMNYVFVNFEKHLIYVGTA